MDKISTNRRTRVPALPCPTWRRPGASVHGFDCAGGLQPLEGSGPVEELAPVAGPDEAFN